MSVPIEQGRSTLSGSRGIVGVEGRAMTARKDRLP
jgi:hypothetical protein